MICALTLEADAVDALFEEHWDINDYGKAEGDTNTYSLGVIGRHAVVLVHMPGMGKRNAAIVAANCHASFLGIQLALVVGVCGGVPFASDGTEVLLGDVVISDGVVQYDFGRHFPDGFLRKNPAVNPSNQAMGFLAKLKGRRGKNMLHERAQAHLNTLRKELGDKAIHPGVVEDRLFESSYHHRHQDPLDCHECTASSDGRTGRVCDMARTSDCVSLKCDLERLVPRRRHQGRPEMSESLVQEEVTPQALVHIGGFASGDSVIKSGEVRDQIANSAGIVAFEMEGAAVWETFPSCLIIKGVSDYTDSHKSKRWQNYAACTAAAATVALLEQWAAGRGKRASPGTFTIPHVQ